MPIGGFPVQFPAEVFTPLRYAILHHTDIPVPHFDLAFETKPGSTLITWRSPTWPIANPTPLERLADHRREYLDYQGPVSNNRGQVHRIVGGTFQFESADENYFQIKTDTGLHLSIRCRKGAIWLAEVNAVSCG